MPNRKTDEQQAAETAAAEQERERQNRLNADAASGSHDQNDEVTDAEDRGAAEREGREGGAVPEGDRPAQRAGAADDDHPREGAADGAAAGAQDGRVAEGLDPVARAEADQRLTELDHVERALQAISQEHDHAVAAGDEAQAARLRVQRETLTTVRDVHLRALASSRTLPDVHTSTGTIVGPTQAAPTYDEIRREFYADASLAAKAKTLNAAFGKNAGLDPTSGKPPELALSIKRVTIPTPKTPDTTVVKA